jgi:hypothetical protein
VPVDNWSILIGGGRGVGSAVIVVGASAVLKKAKLEKGRTHHSPLRKKGGCWTQGAPNSSKQRLEGGSSVTLRQQEKSTIGNEKKP